MRMRIYEDDSDDDMNKEDKFWMLMIWPGDD